MTTILDAHGRPFPEEAFESRNTGFKDPEPWFYEYFAGGGKSTAGEPVNARIAMTVMTFFACVRNISEDFAKSPRKVRRRVGKAKEFAPDYPLQRVFRQPNNYTDRHEFWQTYCAHALTYTGGYAEIEFGRDGRPVALHLIDPTSVFIENVRGQVLYHVVVDGMFYTLMPWQVLHLHGLGHDSITGYNVPVLARQLLGVAVALQKYQGAYFGNNAVPSGVLEHPASLTSAAQERLREQFQERHSGAGKRGRPLLLEEGMKWTSLSHDPEKMQMTEFAKVTWLDICRIFRMPPHKCGFVEASGLTLEQQDRQYHTDTMDSWFDKFRAQSDLKLYPQIDRDLGYETYVVSHALRRADVAVQDAHFKEGFYTGRYSINDIREWEDLEPINGGDRRFTQRNLIPLDRIDELLDKELAVGAEPPGSGDEQPGAKQPEPDAPAEPTANLLAVRSAFQSLLSDRVARVLRSEADKARRASDIEEYYRETGPFVAASLVEHIQAIASALSPEADATEIARRYAEVHVTKSQSDLHVGDLSCWQNGKRAAAAAAWIMEAIAA